MIPIDRLVETSMISGGMDGLVICALLGRRGKIIVLAVVVGVETDMRGRVVRQWGIEYRVLDIRLCQRVYW